MLSHCLIRFVAIDRAKFVNDVIIIKGFYGNKKAPRRVLSCYALYVYALGLTRGVLVVSKLAKVLFVSISDADR